MSGLQTRGEETVNGVDVREQGSALRVATNTPHLVSLGTGRLSTAVTLHPIKQGRVTIGSDPTCDIYVVGTGVASVHCRVENSHGVVTLYPVSGSTLLDGLLVDKATRLSQGSMLTIGRSNYLRFNHPEEAKLMKSVLPSGHVSMAPIQFQPNEQCAQTGYNHTETQCFPTIQKIYKDPTLSQLDRELDLTLKEMSRIRPPVPPKTIHRDSDTDTDQEKPKTGIMAKVTKFERYARQHCIGRSQFYTPSNSEISPKVFSANSLTVNTPAKDVLGGRPVPENIIRNRTIPQTTTDNHNLNREGLYGRIKAVEPSRTDIEASRTERIEVVESRRDNEDRREQNRSFDERMNVSDVSRMAHNDHRIGIESRRDQNFSQRIEQNAYEGRMEIEPSRRDQRILDQRNDLELSRKEQNVYDGRINVEQSSTDHRTFDTRTDVEVSRKDQNFYGVRNDPSRRDYYPCDVQESSRIEEHRIEVIEPSRMDQRNISVSSSAYDRNPQYSPVYSNNQYDRGLDAESMRIKAYQDRIKEEEQKEAEAARLEEILNMCAEYERQIATGNPITPTEKRSHNKIITNGSLPRSVALNNPNFIQTSEGYYKFDTSHNRNATPNQQRNLSGYENFDDTQSPTRIEQLTPEVTIGHYENVGRMDEIGIPVFDDDFSEVSSPILLRKNGERILSSSPIASPYENVYMKGNANYTNLKPKSPKTQSPRTRIKTTFAHKNISTPQYFVFPTPPPNNTQPNFENVNVTKDLNETDNSTNPKSGIEKQLSLEEEIPMIDDSDLTNDLEFRYSKVFEKNEEDSPKTEEKKEKESNSPSPLDEYLVEKTLMKNQSFDDVKKELMADIPELEEFEKDLKQNKREKIIKNLTEDMKKMDFEASSIDSAVLDDNVDELKSKYDSLKEERKKYVAEIHEIKCKMSEIRSQEDDILRELEMEKALIKGEYDSEIAILNIEQKKKAELTENARRIEEEIKQLKEKQEIRQNEMRDRVEIATTKVERIEKDLKENAGTLEELQNAQDILDNETKIYEDLEFQHLEEESELLANREDLQNEIMTLSKKIEAQKSRILTLKSEANNNLTSALDETKILQAEYVRLLNRVETLTGKVQSIEKELKPIVTKLNDIERTQSPDSAFYTDQTRAKSGEFGYSPQTSDSDDIDNKSGLEDHAKRLNEKFNTIDRMSQSMMIDIERRVGDIDCNEHENSISESPSKSSTSSKGKKGFWERNFDSLKRKSGREKKQKSPEKLDIMSQSFNENMFYNNETIESDVPLDKFNSLRHSKKRDNKSSSPVKSSSSSKIPTFAALGKIIKKDSFSKKSNKTEENDKENIKTRYVKNNKPITTDNKYIRAKPLTPDKVKDIKEETAEDIKEELSKSVTFERIDVTPIDVISSITNTEPTNDVTPSKKHDTNEILTKTVDITSYQRNDLNLTRVNDVTPCKRRTDSNDVKVLHRKSCGDEPNKSLSEFQKMADSGKAPSQDDIDRISKVTLDAPILSSDTDMNSLGKRTLDSLMEIERRRIEMLEEQGCQVIENEREKISALKRRAQDETKRLWDQKNRELARSMESDAGMDGSQNELDSRDNYDANSSTAFEESSGFLSSSIEELQVRNSRTESTEDEKRSDDSRPLSHASDFSRDNILSLSNAPRRSRRGVAPAQEWQRPLTRYLPVDRDDFDLRRHVESAGHQIELCPYVTINSTSCRGYLHKLGAKFHTWSKRWFVFDRETKTFVYYWDKSEKKPRGGAYFQVIEEVYLDHGNTSRSPSPQTTFIVKTRQRRYYLMAPSGEAARIWIDVVFTGAQGYTEYLE